MTKKTAPPKPSKGDAFDYTGGLDLEIMTSPPLHVGPHQKGIVAASASQAEHMAASADFTPAKGD